MPKLLMPIPCKPWALSGLSERLVVSHYENEYGGAVRTLNAINDDLAALDLSTAPAHHIRGLKAEEARLANGVALHELYFGSLGGDGGAAFTGGGAGTGIAAEVVQALTHSFGSVAAWRREFIALSAALRHRSGWSMLMYSPRDGRLLNQIIVDDAHGCVDAIPLLVLDMYEHAYHLDFGPNAEAYVDAFMRNIDWVVVGDRFRAASGARSADKDGRASDSETSVSAEELARTLESGERVQVIDARPKHYFSRVADMMGGATWRDPDRVDEWSAELSADAPVIVYCAYGYAVGQCVASVLRERGVDARYVRGGLSAWYAAGGGRALVQRPVK